MIEVERMIKLIEQKRDLIAEWEELKVDNEKALNRQELPRTAFRLRQQELDEKIAQAMAEIEANLQELDVQVERQDGGK